MKLRHLVFVCAALLSSRAMLGQFAQQGPKLVGSGAVGNALQGRSVAISGDGQTAIVGGILDNGGAGAAWVWARTGDSWSQQGAKLVGFGAVGNANQGNAVAISADGNTVIVGGPFDNNSAGAVWVWTRSAGVWTQQGNKLVGSGAVGFAQQGYAVALSADGNTAIVGGHMDGSAAGGAAWVWTRSGGVWTQQGNKLVGSGSVGSSGRQGDSVSLSSDGNTAIIGGYGDNAANGAAWVWTRSGGVWTQQGAKLVGTGAVSGVGNAWQGWSVDLSADGNTAIISAIADNNNTGAIWIWTRSGGFWSQQSAKLTAAGNVGSALVGYSVSLSNDGNTALVGGSGGDGAIWIWTRTGGIWSQQGEKLTGAGAIGSPQLGTSVSLSSASGVAIAGGPLDKGFAGAVWVFEVVPPRRHAVRR
jgi:uncharacterized protein YdbL (DUF1318 family)